MTKPIALQLYTIRDALKADFEGSLRRVAALGYAGVEFAGVYGESPADAARLCRDLGLQIIGAHLPMPVGDHQQQVLDTAAALGINTLVCPWLPQEQFRYVESINRVCDELNAANEVARANGFRFGYHNHDGEFRPADDNVLAFNHMQRLLEPSIFFEVDVFWVKFAGTDPVVVLNDLGARAPFVHLKDGGDQGGEPMRKFGDGIVDIPAVVRAAAAAEWLIVELDNYAGDPFEAVEYNIRFLTEQG